MYSNENISNIPRNSPWFQHDSALPHFSKEMRQYLADVLPVQWFEHTVKLEWLDMSPDLTPRNPFGEII